MTPGHSSYLDVNMALGGSTGLLGQHGSSNSLSLVPKHGQRWRPRRLASFRPLVAAWVMDSNRDPGCDWTTDLDKVFSSILGLKVTMVLGDCRDGCFFYRTASWSFSSNRKKKTIVINQGTCHTHWRKKMVMNGCESGL